MFMEEIINILKYPSSWSLDHSNYAKYAHEK